MTARRRILIGGIGALTPVVLNLLVVDAEVVFRRLTIAVLATYCIRVAILFSVGGFVAWTHTAEREARKLFEAGIVAPALITALLNGSNAERHTMQAPGESKELRALIGFFLPVQAYAQEPGPRVYSISRPPPETLTEAACRGFLGKNCQGQWFVSLPRLFGSPQEAEGAAHVVRENGLSPHIYAVPGGVPGYLPADRVVDARSQLFAVVLSDWAMEASARQLAASYSKRATPVVVWPASAAQR